MTIGFSLVLALSFAFACVSCSSTGRQSAGAADHRHLSDARHGIETNVAMVRVTTNAHGNIVAAAIVKSTGSEALDRAAVEKAKTKWHGPISATTDIAIDYQSASGG